MNYYLDAFPGRKVNVNGASYRYFGGTSYLGLQDYTPFQDLFIKNIKQYGTNYGASRKSNIRFTIFETAERHLAELVGSETCLTLSSGYLAGQFLAQFLKEQHHKLFYAPNTHSALVVDTTKTHTSYKSLLEDIEDHLTTNRPSTPVLFLDSIDFSGVHYPILTHLKNLPLSEMIIVADDSHGIGVLGTKGEGVFRELKELGAKQVFVCCSLGKGFGIQAGAIFGDKEQLDQMENTAFFGGASPPSPAAMATYVDAQKIYHKRRGKLKQNMDLFLKETHSFEGFLHFPEHPTFSYRNKKLTQKLFEHQILVTSFNYPDAKAGIMSRIVLSAAHKEKDILKLSALLNSL